MKAGTTTVQHRGGRLEGEFTARGPRRRYAESPFIMSTNLSERSRHECHSSTVQLLMPQRFDGVKAGGFQGREITKDHADGG